MALVKLDIDLSIISTVNLPLKMKNNGQRTPSFKIILVDPNTALCEAWAERFSAYEHVEIKNDVFQNIESFDCIASAANSFGLMDGGIDLAISNFFGAELSKRVQERISLDYFGEQPVGTSMIVETKNKKYPFLAHTPTMRVPLKITNTDNVYLAMFAMLRAVTIHNRTENQKINVVVCPGLGTSAGKMTPNESARQMELAYRNFCNPPKYVNWMHLIQRQKEIIYGGDVKHYN